MPRARITDKETGKSTLVQCPNEKCNHGFAILIAFQEHCGDKPDDALAWARLEAVCAKHRAEDAAEKYKGRKAA